MDKWIVTYARITIDKEHGIVLNGVYFGGLVGNNDEAELVAKECVNTIKGGTILPKIIRLTSECIIDALLDAETKFIEMANRMRDADDIINRGNR